MDPPEDAGVEELDRATTDAERLLIEAQLLEQTDNRPRPEDGEQPSQETEGPRALGVREQILARARSQLGVHEEPFGSNRTPYSQWYGLIGPWCAMFVSWCFFQEGLPLPASTAKGFAYTPVGAAWFQPAGPVDPPSGGGSGHLLRLSGRRRRPDQPCGDRGARERGRLPHVSGREHERSRRPDRGSGHAAPTNSRDRGVRAPQLPGERGSARRRPTRPLRRLRAASRGCGPGGSQVAEAAERSHGREAGRGR